MPKYGFQSGVLRCYLLVSSAFYYIHYKDKIIVLFRHQGYEKERFSGSICLNNFLERLYANDICGNFAYVISDEE